MLPPARCALTAPFHPYLPPPLRAKAGGIFSVPLSFELPRPGVTRRTALRSSDFPLANAPRGAKANDHLAHCGGDAIDTCAMQVSPIVFLADAVLLQLLVQVAPRRTDHLGGFRDVPVVLAEIVDEERPFSHLFELAQGTRPFLLASSIIRRLGPGFNPYDVPQVIDVDSVAGGHDDEALDGIAQLPDVSLPARPLHVLQCRRGESLRTPVVLAAEEIGEVAHQRRDVFAAVAQRGHADRDHAQPEEQVLAEG